MVTITGSTLRITATPRVAAFHRVRPDVIEFFCTGALNAIGAVTLTGDANAVGVGWVVGFLQAQVTETNYALYRGITAEAGTVIEDRTGVALPVVPCFDAWAPGTPFAWSETERLGGLAGTQIMLPSTVRAPITFAPAGETLTVGFVDKPSVPYLTMRRNGTTGQFNFINEVYIDFGFVTVLAVRDPSGRFHYLRGFTWSIRWHQKVAPNGPRSIGSVPIAGGDRFVLGPMFEGAPKDAAALRVFEGARATTCNLIGNQAQDNPNLRMVDGWPSYTPPR